MMLKAEQLIAAYFMGTVNDYDTAKRMADGLVTALFLAGYKIAPIRKKKTRQAQKE